ncbi:MAG: methyltransferase domain-containing protein [Chitinispirillia bacterium]|nr:methyltransferase domain-containing protein [Chitinispirillia bacterium]MCL2242677.1 methyltransferase domain-containing protein [Chitinispirillia bacterium]
MSLDKKTYQGFADLLYDRCGIALGDQKEALVSARIGKRLRTLGMTTFKEYLDLIKSPGPDAEKEFTEFMNVMTTNTTHFFREIDHFNFMAEAVQQMVAEGRTKIRIWCAASSSGEEPYTLAMTFLENSQGFRGDCKILATDIDYNILAMARAGEYSEAKMKDVPQQLRTKYFTSTGMGKDRMYKANSTLAGMISFNRLNLAKPPFPMKGPFDLIFCRNVMIYFDNIVRKNLLAEFERLLRPGGYLMVGHSESMAGGLCNLPSAGKPSIYVKPGK